MIEREEARKPKFKEGQEVTMKHQRLIMRGGRCVGRKMDLLQVKILEVVLCEHSHFDPRYHIETLDKSYNYKPGHRLANVWQHELYQEEATT